ncbi:MAG: hypothetical protein IPK66_06525 [Rhodospirillales bacterium]|nr:hypothetical protein [Rhodospirillales bacterium]
MPLNDLIASGHLGRCEITRRTALASLTLGLVALCPWDVPLAAEGVWLRGQLCSAYVTMGSRQVQIETSTGDRNLDRQLMLEARHVARTFDVWPGLKILVEPSSLARNALATSETLVDGTAGTVMLGRTLVLDELQRDRRGWGGLTVAGLMAHEFGHIFQYKSGYHAKLKQGSKTDEPVELHADYLAGYHLGRKRRDGANMDIGAFMDGIYFMGDDHEDDPRHHGSSEERRRAVREGYRTGVEGLTPIQSVAARGYDAVREIMRM